MDNAIIFDIALGVILLVGFVVGAVRGLFKSLMGLVAVVAALLIAAFAANLLVEPITEYVYPKVEEKMVETFSDDLDGLLTARSGGEGDDSLSVLTDFLEEHGVTEDSQIRKLLAVFASAVSEGGSGVKDKAVDTYRAAIAESVKSLIAAIVHGVVFFVLFVVVLAVLKLLVRALDKVFDLPGLSTLNGVGGGLLGLAEAVLLIFLALWVTERVGVTWFRDHAEGTYLLSFFLNNTPKSLISILLNGR